jgi:hypothetical protein
VACHGDPERFFRLFAPGRTRLSHDTPILSPATVAELDANYDRARGMLSLDGHPAASLLLTKPLDPGAGGDAHGGIDSHGRDVYISAEDPGFLVLVRWANTAASP